MANTRKKTITQPTKQNVDALWDSKDLRDLIYLPTLRPLKSELYPDWKSIKVLNQKNEGSCTGFGLAATINYLNRIQNVVHDASPRMLYEMAKRYDQWPGRNYEGSTARGAMKGWYKHGVCSDSDWPYLPPDDVLSASRIKAAANCQLGSYFRVLPRRNDVQAALNEVGVIYASAAIHLGWDKAYGKADIKFDPIKHAFGRQNKSGSVSLQGHAFAIIGYNADGLLVLNSWGNNLQNIAWGGFKVGKDIYDGVALWSYPDFEANVWDLWVARPAVKVNAQPEGAGKYALSSSGSRQVTAAPPLEQTVGHYIHIDDGQFDTQSEFPCYAQEIKKLIEDAVNGSKGKHLMLYAHGGLNSVEEAAMRAYKWRNVFPANDIRCLHFIWETGLFEAIKDLLFGKDKFAEERVGGFSDWWDDVVEGAVARLGGAVWHEMQDDARIAFEDNGAGRKVLGWLKDALDKAGEDRPKIHLAGHSAGSIWHAHLLSAWQDIGGGVIESLTLFAPACTHDVYNSEILPACTCNSGTVKNLHHFYLTDEREQDDDVALIYRKSLLYLVSNALENLKTTVPLMGMARYNSNLKKPTNNYWEYIAGKSPQTNAGSHGGFDNDAATMNSLVKIIAGRVKRDFLPTELDGY